MSRVHVGIGLAMVGVVAALLWLTPAQVKSCSVPSECQISTNVTCTSTQANWSSQCGGDCDPSKFEIWMFCHSACMCTPNPTKLGEVKWTGDGSYQFSAGTLPPCHDIQVRLINGSGVQLHNMMIYNCGQCPCY
jgi:hypothetical protein